MYGKRQLGLLLSVVMLAPLSGCDIDEGGGGGGPVTFRRGFAFVRGEDLYVADDTDFGNPNRLTTSGFNRQPSFSANGRQIAFVHADPAGHQLQTISAGGSSSGPNTVYSATTGQRNFRTPVFSPDGSFIVFAYEENSASHLGRVNVDGSGFMQLTSGTNSYSSPSFYPSGQYVLAVAGSPNQLQQVNATTGVTQTVATSLNAVVSSIANRAVLSPDGSQVSFDGRLASNTSEVRIFVMKLSSGVTTQLTDHVGETAIDSFPTWVSATQIGFSSNSGGSDQVYVLPSNAVKTSGGFTLASAKEPWFGGGP
jgi:TolB protein